MLSNGLFLVGAEVLGLSNILHCRYREFGSAPGNILGSGLNHIDGGLGTVKAYQFELETFAVPPSFAVVIVSTALYNEVDCM